MDFAVKYTLEQFNLWPEYRVGVVTFYVNLGMNGLVVLREISTL